MKTTAHHSQKRIHITVRGVVQGVGFRPFVYGVATHLGLAGFVFNEPGGVELELEGPSSQIDAFLHQLQHAPPPLARIQSIITRDLPLRGERDFAIRHSEQDGVRTVLIAADQATCSDCLREMHDPDDRRYGYPFINCTNCGPRYTIIRDVPYDRAKTTMASFAMCPQCQTEYEDPSNRRFHAEPTCCPACGPHIWLAAPSGNRIKCESPIAEAVRALHQGAVVAVKGLGGFHLACDATNAEAVRALRKRKNRDLKPFAIMAKDTATARRICHVPDSIVPHLESSERPILLLDKRDGHGIADEVAPRTPSFGVMLPYTPLHHLLLEGPCPVLVMTSGNISDEPIAHLNDEAFTRLASMADVFLLHDRGIHIRTDDSVARVAAGRLRFLRRSRGYAPYPVELPSSPDGSAILAVGPELNNTICVTRGNDAFMSHHIGDLHNGPAHESFVQAIQHLQSVLAVEPGVIACDLHPGYLSTQYARACGLPLEAVQHHHAHVASVLAEHGRTGKIIGISFDGMGWGSDGTLWGGEFMTCDLSGFERVAHLVPVPQPGGDAAAKQIPRMAYSYLHAAFGGEADGLARELLPRFAEKEQAVVARLIERNLNCPVTSSVGRLFDAASALLGICDRNSFHAQAPMELEARAWEAPEEEGFYQASIETLPSGTWAVCAADVIRQIVAERRAGIDPGICAARFHNAIACFSLEICRRIRENTTLSTVGLAGGVFANAFLLERLTALLERDGFEVLLNEAAPAGDGGVSLGQAAVAAWRLQCA